MREIPPGRIVFLTASVVAINLLFPLSRLGAAGGIIYNVFYTLLFISGALTVARSRRALIVLLGVGAVSFTLGTVYYLTLIPTIEAVWALSVFLFQLLVVGVLVDFIFSTPSVTRSVLLAAVAVYMLLADLFIPVYNFIYILDPSSFTQPGLEWQDFLYYSFATLTTLGYGDISPVTDAARAVAGFQATVGVLYITILMGRLIGLYAQEQELL